ncbi:hypothetical protein VTJ83DRAFT_4194 [Remersonia thermophila]|uniref:Regulator of phospholipase D SRF1 n=1 Tax=Remersonia thermophila TaxID=72144 RepID=A0ABR4D970_9PEZI
MASSGHPSSSSQLSEPRPSTTRSPSTAARSVPGSTHHGFARTLPPWIESYEPRFGVPSEDQLRALSCPPPPRALAPEHNHMPSPIQRRVSRDGFVHENPAVLGLEGPSRTSHARLRKMLRRRNSAERGRKWDHLRSAEPVIVHRFSRAMADSPWRGYVNSSRYGRLPNEESEIVDPDVLEKLQPGFNDPVDLPQLRAAAGDTRRNVLYKRLWHILLRHPLVPLAFRLTVLLTSIVALALAVQVFRIEHRPAEPGAPPPQGHSAELTQAIVAIVVDTVAIPYIGYMTWDEYTGQPLGLRPATQKISLVLMDLFFIIFKSASTALAFEALVSHNSTDRRTRELSKALAAFQVIGLISWSLNLSVSVFRLVQKLGGGDDGR